MGEQEGRAGGKSRREEKRGRKERAEGEREGEGVRRKRYSTYVCI